MKKSELLFSFLLLPVDWLMIVAGSLLVYAIRYSDWFSSLRPPIFIITAGDYAQIVALVAALWLPVFALAGLYTIRANVRLVQEFFRVILGCSTGLVGIVLFIFFRAQLFGSRFLILAGYLASIIFVFLGRIIIRSIQRSLLKKGTGVVRLVVIGSERSAEKVIDYLRHDKAAGFAVVRHFHILDSAAWGSLRNIARGRSADMIIQADNSLSREVRATLWQFCREHHLEFAYAADIFESKTSNFEVMTLAGIPIIQIKRTPLDGWGRIVKRVTDIIVAIFTLVIISPLALLMAIAIKLDSRGPVFVKLTRVGEGGKLFTLYKFRSMFVGAHNLKYDPDSHLQELNERKGPLFKIKNDPRVTRVGKYIRKLSLDEFGNFINVLKGDMSLVGPRPHEPEEVGRYTPNQKRLLTIKPGVTGLAQISGRSDLDFSEEERLDIFYIENWNFWLDIQILLRTPWVVLTGKNAF